MVQGLQTINYWNWDSWGSWSSWCSWDYRLGMWPLVLLVWVINIFSGRLCDYYWFGKVKTIYWNMTQTKSVSREVDWRVFLPNMVSRHARVSNLVTLNAPAQDRFMDNCYMPKIINFQVSSFNMRWHLEEWITVPPFLWAACLKVFVLN